MARGPESTPHDALEVIDSYADRIAGWIASNPVPVIGCAVLVLLLAAGIGGYRAWSGGREDRASTALAKVERDYLAAMGASPGAIEVPEPANPETGKAIRREYAAKLLAMAAEHPGAAASAVAQITAGDLLEAAGEPEKAEEAWRAGMAQLSGSDPLRGIALRRVATSLEAQGKWKEAAAAHLEAAELPGFPLERWALADAARCSLEAGDREQATALATRAAALGQGGELPPHLEQAMAELRAQAALPPTSGASAGPTAEPAEAP